MGKLQRKLDRIILDLEELSEEVSDTDHKESLENTNSKLREIHLYDPL